jgi:transposase-like protein
MSISPTPTPVPTEVTPTAKRRTFTAEYKRGILREADGCKQPGQVGALLRREGLYTSHLTEWRRARDRGELAGEPRRRGPPPKAVDARDGRIAELERENIRLQHRVKRAEAIVELQKSSGAARDAAAGRGRDAAMRAVEDAVGELGAAAACDALGVPRASFYRWRAPLHGPHPQSAHARALVASERAEVLALLHEERFVDKAPVEVYVLLSHPDHP